MRGCANSLESQDHAGCDQVKHRCKGILFDTGLLFISADLCGISADTYAVFETFDVVIRAELRLEDPLGVKRSHGKRFLSGYQVQ
jgi:hypothetical protein